MAQGVKMKFSEFLKEQSTDLVSGLHDAIMKFIKEESGSNKVHSLVNTKNLYSENADTYFGVYTGFITIKGSSHDGYDDEEYYDDDEEYDDSYAAIYSAKLKDGKWVSIEFFRDGDTERDVISSLKSSRQYSDVKAL